MTFVSFNFLTIIYSLNIKLNNNTRIMTYYDKVLVTHHFCVHPDSHHPHHMSTCWLYICCSGTKIGLQRKSNHLQTKQQVHKSNLVAFAILQQCKTSTMLLLPVVKVQRCRTQRSKLQLQQVNIRFMSKTYCLTNWMNENIHSQYIMQN